ncbi:MAG: hypothetical protein GC159_01180 [Phycisphaera sp.]|nr:hypothetical protein [Phycisphaera sp.]
MFETTVTQFSRVLATLLLSAMVLSPSLAAEEESNTPWEVIKVGNGAIAVPRGWRSFDGLKPTMPIMRQGDGIGVPLVDETSSPLQIGLTVELFPESSDSVRQTVDKLIDGAKRAPGLEQQGKESVKSLKLSDGTEALLLEIAFIKQKSRRSFQMKLVAKGPDSTTWIASGYLVGGKDSTWPINSGRLVEWLKAHVVSMTLNKERIDTKAVEAAYKKRDGNE